MIGFILVPVLPFTPSLANNQVAQATSLTLQLFQPDGLSLNAYYQLLLPSEFTFQTGTLPCADNILPANQPTCTLIGSVVTIRGLAPTPQPFDFIAYVTFPITNPSFKGDFILTLTRYSDVLNTQQESIEIVEALLNCVFSFVNPVVNSQSDISISVTPTTRITSSDVLIIKQPRFWKTEATQKVPIPLSQTVICSSATAPQIDCLNSNLGSDLVIIVSGLTINPTSSTVSFRLSSISTPPTNDPSQGFFVFQLKNRNDKLIEQSSQVFVSGLQPGPISSISYSPVIQTVSALSVLVLSFRTYSPLTSNDKVQIVFPPEVSLQISSVVYKGVALAKSLLGSTLSISVLPNANSALQPSLLVFTISSVNNQPTRAYFSLLTVNTKRANFLIDSGQFNSFVPLQQALTCTPTFSTLQRTATSTLTLAIAHSLPWTTSTQIKLQLATCLVAVPTATCTQFRQGISFSGFSLSPQTSNVQVSGQLTIPYLSTTLKVSSYNGALSESCQVGVNPGAVSAPSSNLVISSSSTQTYSDATLTLTYTLLNTIPSDAQIRLSLDRFIITSRLTCLCSTVSVPCSTTASLLTIYQCFRAAPTAQLSISLQGVKNSASNQPNSVDLKIYRGASLLQSCSSTFTVGSLSGFQLITLTSSQRTVSLPTTLNVSFSFPPGIVSQMYVQVSLGTISTGSASCSGPVSLSCSVVGAYLVITYGNLISSPALTFIIISGTTNPANTQPTSLSFTVKDQAGFSFLSSSLTYSALPALLALTLTYTSQALAASSSLSVAVSCSPSYQSTTIIFPSEIGIVSCPSCTVSGNTISFAGSSKTVSITNPSSINKIPFEAYTYSGSQLVCAYQGLLSFQLACDLPCAECVAGSPSQCLSCYSVPLQRLANNQIYYYGTNKQCLSACPQNTFVSSSACLDCPLSCSACTSLSTCISCLVGLLSAGQCLSACPLAQYPVNNVCVPCAGCGSCSISGACTSCATGFLTAGTCKSACPLGQYGSSNTCLPCIANCLSCSSSSCLICFKGYFLPSCSQGCSASTFVSTTGVCTACLCASCSIYNYRCTACTSSSLFQSVCVNNCPTGYFSQSSTCQVCPAACASCQTPVNCQTCKPAFTLFNSFCSSTCPAGWANVDQICTACISSCLTCSVLATKCDSCAATLFMHRGQCLATCPTPYQPYLGNCVLNLPPCLTAPPCTNCAPGFYLLAGNCYANCPATYFNNDGTGQCQLCQPPCITCTTLTQCLSCALLVQNGNCVASCSNGYLLESGSSTCYLCDSRCVSCVSSPFVCSACNPGYIYDPNSGHCGYSCSSPYFLQNDSCVLCSQACLACDTYADICSSCSSGYFLLAGSCVLSCSQGYFGNQGLCKSCPSSCSACFNASACSRCRLGFSYFELACVYECPSRLPLSAQSVCVNCLLQGCMICSGEGSCTQCISPYLLYQGQCFLQCLQGYIGVGGKCAPNITYAAFLETQKASVQSLPFFSTFLALIALLAVLVGVLAGYRIYVIGLAYLVFGLAEFSVSLLVLFNQLQVKGWSWQGYLILGGLGTRGLLNLAGWMSWDQIQRDCKFEVWKEEFTWKYYAVKVLSLFTTHKLLVLNFTFLYEHPFFSAPLTSTDKFDSYKVLALLQLSVSISLLLPSVFIFLAQQFKTTKLLLLSAQAILISIACFLLTLFWGYVRQLSFFRELDQPIPSPELDFKELQQEFLRKPRSVKGQDQEHLEMDRMSEINARELQPVPVVKNQDIPQALEEGQFRVPKKRKWYESRTIEQLSEQEESEASAEGVLLELKEEEVEEVTEDWINPLLNINYAKQKHLGRRY